MINSDGVRVPVYGTPEEWLAWLVGADADRAHEATLILGGIEVDDDVPLEPLLAALSADRRAVAFWAIVALGRLGARAAPAVPQLCEIARAHEAFGVRQAALLALVQIAPAAPAVKDAVVQALADQNPFVRGQALQAMISIPDVSPEEVERLAALQQDPDRGVAFWAEVAVRNIQRR